MTIPQPQKLGFSPVPQLGTPLVDSNGNISIPWYRFILNLWQTIGGLGQQVTSAVYLSVTNGVVSAFQSLGGVLLGTIIFTKSRGSPAIPLVLGASPFIYIAPVSGSLLVYGGQLEMSRDNAVTWYPVGLTGGALRMLFDDQARVTWFGAAAPPVVFMPDGLS
jgi:hypothetical protein